MNIEIGTERLPDDPKWRWSPDRPLTGTTKFYVRVAEALARKGHRVKVLRSGEYLPHNGVVYGPDNSIQPDLVLDCNLQRHRGGNQGRRMQWTSFFNRPDTCVGEGYDRLFLVTEYVKSTLAPHLKAPATVLELGNEMPVLAEPNTSARDRRCCYTSSPDRGGTFLQGIWPEVERRTGYTLECSPYGTEFSDADLTALYDRSQFWLYPALGTDSILSTLEAQARGCIPFVVPHMGLPETLRYGIKTDIFRFRETLIRCLLDAQEIIPNLLAARSIGLASRPLPTWDDVAERILDATTGPAI